MKQSLQDVVYGMGKYEKHIVDGRAQVLIIVLITAVLGTGSTPLKSSQASLSSVLTK